MLFMVIERFRGGDPGPVGERFARCGRMMPEGVEYVSSWVEAATGRCFQVMEAPDAAALKPWMNSWEDLVEFEVVPVLTSQEYWKAVRREE
jgi:hypothetical protein